MSNYIQIGDELYFKKNLDMCVIIAGNHNIYLTQNEMDNLIYAYFKHFKQDIEVIKK